MPVVASVTCPVCGTFCDDIELIIENNRIIEAKNACAMGAAKFLNYNDHRINYNDHKCATFITFQIIN